MKMTVGLMPDIQCVNVLIFYATDASTVNVRYFERPIWQPFSQRAWYAAPRFADVVGISRACAHIFARSKFSLRILLRHPRMHSCYAFGRQIAAVRRGNRCKS